MSRRQCAQIIENGIFHVPSFCVILYISATVYIWQVRYLWELLVQEKETTSDRK